MPDGSFLVPAHAVGLYASIPYSTGWSALKSILEKWKDNQMPTSDLLKMTKFVFGTNYFEFFDNVSLETSGIGTKFVLLLHLHLHERSWNRVS